MAPGAWAGLSSAVQRTLDEPDRSAVRIVAERGGELLGTVLLYPPASDAYRGLTGSLQWPEVRLLAVAPEARQQGVGKALMEECVRRARAMGADTLGLHTSASLRIASGMYERMGFERDPEHDFQAGVSACLAPSQLLHIHPLHYIHPAARVCLSSA